MNKFLVRSIRKRNMKRVSKRDYSFKHGGFWYWNPILLTGYWVHSNTQGSLLNSDAPQSLFRSLKTHSERTNVVVTHFPPLIECKHPHIESNILDTYFNNDLGEFVSEHDIKYWVYGHNHFSDEFELYGTRFISNQMGYPREKTGYDSHTLFNLGGWYE